MLGSSPLNTPKVPMSLVNVTSTFEFVFERVVVLIEEISLLYRVNDAWVVVATFPVVSYRVFPGILTVSTS